MDALLNILDYKTNGVNFKLISPKFLKSTEKLPFVFYYHGWSSSVKNSLFLCKIFALNGFNVVIPEIINHDSRGTIDYMKKISIKSYFWDTVFKTTEEFKEIYNFIKDLGFAAQKIGIIGSSMGGFIASGIFSENTFVNSIIILNGAISWGKAEKVFGSEKNSFIGNEIQKERIFINDPILKMNNLYERSILILHGDSDTSVPLKIQNHSYKKLIQMNSDSENIKMITFKNLNHSKPIEMIQIACEWFEKYLKI